jgi:hypothetical protein
MLQLQRLDMAALSRDPFDHISVTEMVDPMEIPAIVRDFPQVPAGGSFDATGIESGPAFKNLLSDLHTAEFRDTIARKFEIDLSGLPLHITVRGEVRGRDGGIHTDSKEKVLTGLLYLNPEWTETGGRLRLLRNGKDIEDYAAEVAPLAGNMLVFRRSENSWHGHLPAKGRRLSLQFNWVTDDSYVKRELARHRLSGWMKRLGGARQQAN